MHKALSEEILQIEMAMYLQTTEVDEDGTETRTYPYGSLFSHVIGYNDSQFGKTGLESAQNFDLLTSNAFFMEKIQNEFKGEKDQGDTVVTTLDAELQQAAYDALGGEQRSGYCDGGRHRENTYSCFKA